MANTTASAFSAAFTFKVKQALLKNLRASLVWADPALADPGDFDPGHDTITWGNVPDLAVNTTPLTEGTAVTPKALTLTTVSMSTAQYGDAVSISDLAKVKSPWDLAQIGGERLARQANESLDQIARDVIAASGTVFFMSADHTTRATLDSSDTATAALLRKLRTKMKKAKIPMFADRTYRLYVHPDVAYDLKSDSDTAGGWIAVAKYAQPTALLTGEIGQLEGFRIVEVINAPTFSSSVTVYGSIAVGAIKAWGAGSLQTMETYHILPGGDHTDFMGQQELLSWKVNWGTAVLSNDYYFRVESAATAV